MSRRSSIRPVLRLALLTGAIGLLCSGFAVSTAAAAAFGNSGILGAEGNVDLPRFPSISPDGETVVFSWRGDLWRVPFGGGTATRLTSHPGRDHDSAWTPDGSMIVFESDRDGTTNLWRMAPDGTGLRRITDLDTSVALGGVGHDADGEVVVGFTGYLEGDLYRSPRPYEVSIEGGEPRRLHDAFGGLNVRSPDGTRAAFERGNAKWERRHYRGDDRRNVWIHDGMEGGFTPLTDWEGNDGKPRWSGDDAVLFLSDRQNSTTTSTGSRSAREKLKRSPTSKRSTSPASMPPPTVERSSCTVGTPFTRWISMIRMRYPVRWSSWPPKTRSTPRRTSTSPDE